MDRYMNDTHSLYYNVDHSSMFGSNLSTVFADGPPPLEDGDDDHGEFVFSSETDAISEAVLSKIESKLQRDAEGRLVGEKSSLNPEVDINPNSSTEKFEAFANFETANQIDTSSKQDAIQEVNGYKRNLSNIAMSDHDFSDEEFGDFSTCFGKSSHDSNFGDFSTFNNESKLDGQSMFSHSKQASFNGENDVNTGSNSNDFQFAHFSGVNCESSDDSVVEQHLGNESGTEKMENETENASDDEFASFTQASESDFVKFETNKPDGAGSLTNPNPDVIPANEQNNLTIVKLQPDLTNHETKNHEFSSLESFKDDISASEGNELTSTKFPHNVTNHKTKHNDDEFNSFEAFEDDIPRNTSNDLKSAKLPHELTNEAKGDDDFNSFEAFKDDTFNEFTSSSSNDFGNFSSIENELGKDESQSNNNESQASKTDVSNPDTNSECESEGNIASPEDDDFGDFADFSNNSFDAFKTDSGITPENHSDDAFGSFSQENEASWNESNFGAFSENIETNESKESKILSKNNSTPSRQDSDEFTAFSESTRSKNEPEFKADFGAFAENTSSKNKPTNFGAFAESTSSKNRQGFQADFGTFSQKSFDQASSNKQCAIQLVSLHACFQDVFVTLQYKVEDLRHVKVPGKKRINEENLWENLHSNMGEAAVRFNWGKCKTSDKMCKALEVSKKNIVTNPNILAMSEGLEIPVFATGLGILQPSIVPTLPKKKKTKSKQPKKVTSQSSDSASPTPPPSLPQQTTFSEFKTESIKDNNSDTASLSNSDTASLDLDFFASGPSNLPANTDQSSSSSLYNLDFAFGPASSGNQGTFVNNQPDVDVFKTSRSVQDDPLEILKKLDTSKMSSSVVNEDQTQLSLQAKEIIETFDDLSFMHSSVLMFPLHKNI